MERVLIFGSTKEGREMARMLRRRGRQVVFSVTTEYARTQLPPGTLCHVGRLNEAAMLTYIREVAPNRVVDATHPYAVAASQNILHCADTLGIPCERIQIESITEAWRDAVEWVYSTEEVSRALHMVSGNVLLGIGKDQISQFTPKVDLTRMYARIDPIPASVAVCLELGFPPENIIAMRGPFSEALTTAFFDEKNISAVAVRDATDSDYLNEMVIPALERGMHVIMLASREN